MPLIDRLHIFYESSMPIRGNDPKIYAEYDGITQETFANSIAQPMTKQEFSVKANVPLGKGERFSNAYTGYLNSFKRALEAYDEFQALGEINTDAEKLKKIRIISNNLKAKDVYGGSTWLTNYLDDILLQNRFHELLIREHTG